MSDCQHGSVIDVSEIHKERMLVGPIACRHVDVVVVIIVVVAVILLNNWI